MVQSRLLRGPATLQTHRRRSAAQRPHFRPGHNICCQLPDCLPASPVLLLAMGLHKIVNQIGHRFAKTRRKRAGAPAAKKCNAIRVLCVSVPDSGGGTGELGAEREGVVALAAHCARRSPGAHRGQPPAPPRKPRAVPAAAAAGALAALSQQRPRPAQPHLQR